MKTSHPLLLSIILAALPCSGVLAGNVYKWVDEHGVVHYTDQAPATQAAETLRIKTNQSAPSATAADDGLDGALEDLKRQQEVKELAQRQAAETEQERQANQQRCAEARKNLDTIQNNARIRIDENGSQRYLTPEEILEKRDAYEKVARESCPNAQ